MRPILNRGFLAAAFGIVLSVSCENAVAPEIPAFSISDAGNGGADGFYFLPPMVQSAGPFTGSFDGTLTPTVRICSLPGCTTVVTSIPFDAGPGTVTLNTSREYYKATWMTPKTLTLGQDGYRLQVLLGTAVLGYADLFVARKVPELKSTPAGYVGVVAGGNLQIRFRIETGACGDSCGFRDGDFIAYPQGSWGSESIGGAAAILRNNFATVYPRFVEVGIPGAGGFSMIFTSASAIEDYLPAIGPLGALNADLLDVNSSASGAFGGEVLALQLNVDFSAAGITLGAAGIPFGDLTLCNLTELTLLNGLNLRQFLTLVNIAVGGGGGSTYTFAQLNALTDDLNHSFAGGFVSAFAQAHLCAPHYTQGDVITHSQDSWGQDPFSTNAAALLAANFAAVYPGSIVEVGVSGTGGFSMFFTSAAAVNIYLPALGTAGALNSDLLDTSSSASGGFGGEVLALQINVDFSDAGLMLGTLGIPFGNFALCNLTDFALLNGLTVRQFLAHANTALGGGGSSYTFAQLNALTHEINNAFSNGQTTRFAQDHLCH